MFNVILKFLGNKSVKNGMWLYLLQIFNTIVPMLTLPYITRILDESQYGVYSLAVNLIGYFQVVVAYGFGMSASRKVSLMKEKGEVNSQSISHIEIRILGARFLLLISSVFLASVYINLVGMDTSQRMCVYIMFLSLVGFSLEQNWLFQGMQDMKYISLLSIIFRTVSVVLTFILVKEPSDLYVYCLLFSVSPLLSGFIGLSFSVKKYKIRIMRIEIHEIWDELKDGWFVFTTSLSSKVVGAIGITFLGFYATTSQVGIFSAIQKISYVVIMMWSPVSQVLYPLASAHFGTSFDEGAKFVKRVKVKILPLFIAFCALLIVFSKTVVSVAFGESYATKYYWLIPLLLWVIVSINNNFLGVQMLLGSGHDKEYSKCFQIDVLCTVLVTFLGTYYMGADGAAFAPLLSEIILGICLRTSIKKIGGCEVNRR